MSNSSDFRNVRRPELLSTDVEPRGDDCADLRLVWRNFPMRVAVDRAQAAALSESLRRFAEGDADGT